jgi:hypothetical protein
VAGRKFRKQKEGKREELRQEIQKDIAGYKEYYCPIAGILLLNIKNIITQQQKHYCPTAETLLHQKQNSL